VAAARLVPAAPAAKRLWDVLEEARSKGGGGAAATGEGEAGRDFALPSLSRLSEMS